MAAVVSAPIERNQFLAELVDAGLIIESGVPGIYGHNEAFEEVRQALELRLTREARAQGAERLRFPPVLPRHLVERTGYLGNFPHLAGAVYAFEGTEAQAVAQGVKASGHEDWSECQAMTEVMLTPAACYPVYPAIAARGPVPDGGTFVEAGGSWVFRHEPSPDPARCQSFRQHELVRIGAAHEVSSWRDAWALKGLQLLRDMGLEAELQPANDPFFGRRGRMLAANQRDDVLKLELVVPIAGREPTAVASFNQHRDHFGSTFGIEQSDGTTAHTACAGFGHERIVLALLRAHGLTPSAWPGSVRSIVWDR